MSTYTETVGNKLNDLLARTYDAEKGFKKAADNIENNKALKSFLDQKARERYDFGHELKKEIRSYGEKPEKGGSIEGNAHRTWMDVKAFFSSENDESMLEEIIRGEKTAVEDYKEVLNETALPSSTRVLLQHQKNKIENSLSTVKKLEDIA